MIFGKKKKKKNKYSLVREARDLEVARLLKSKLHWKAIIAALALCNVVVLAYGSANAVKPALQPYVISITEDVNVGFVGLQRRTRRSFDDATIRYYLIRFIENSRQIVQDQIAMRQNVSDAWTVLSQNAANTTMQQINEEGIFELANNGYVRLIEFALFQREAENTWRVEWVETTRQYGALVSRNRMEGIFTIASFEPPTEEIRERNPFGFQITEYFIRER